jgi:hypothetical protein
MNDITSNKKPIKQFLDIYKCDLIIGVDSNQISILKNKYQTPKENLTIEEIEDISIDLICVGLQIHYRDIFCEGLKQEIKTKLQEIIKAYKVK